MTTVDIIDGDELKSGDTEPDLTVQLRKTNGVPYTLDSHEVRVLIKEVDGDELIVDDDTDGDVTIDDEDNGLISYSWQSGDTDTVATYIGEVKVEELDESDETTGQIISFPSSGNFEIRVQESLD